MSADGDIVREALAALGRAQTLRDFDIDSEAVLAALARLEAAEKERDEALDLAEKSWQAAWAKAQRQWFSDVTDKLPAAEAQRDALAEALRDIVAQVGSSSRTDIEEMAERALAETGLE